MSLPFTVIDLTHTLSPTIATWDSDCGFAHELIADYNTTETDVKFRVQKINMHAGIGTHIDAPAHCFAGAASIADLDINQLIAPCIVIDVSDKSHEKYRVSPEDIISFEGCYGIIPPKSFVIIRTGWDRYFGHPEKYRNNLLFPCVSKEAALLLLNREIVGLGIDTLSPDRVEDNNSSDLFAVHNLILGSGNYLIENIANSGSLPAIGSYSLALAMKIQDGTEAPVRLIGLIMK